MATLEQVLRDKLTERFKRTQEAIIGGGPQDFSQYRYMVGYLRGVYDAIDDILPICRRYDEHNGDEDE